MATVGGSRHHWVIEAERQKERIIESTTKQGHQRYEARQQDISGVEEQHFTTGGPTGTAELYARSSAHWSLPQLSSWYPEFSSVLEMKMSPLEIPINPDHGRNLKTQSTETLKIRWLGHFHMTGGRAMGG